MKYSIICLFFVSIFIFVPFTAVAEDPSENIAECEALAEVFESKAVFGPCLALSRISDCIQLVGEELCEGIKMEKVEEQEAERLTDVFFKLANKKNKS